LTSKLSEYAAGLTCPVKIRGL